MNAVKITDFSMDTFSLKGKTAIVTGGNGGLGQAFSVAMAKAGANVFIPSLVDDDGTTQQLIEAEGVAYHFFPSDITEKGVCKQVVEECVKTFGTVDILINCAGRGINIENVLEFDREPWDKVLALNLTAAFEMSHECAKIMIPKKSGKIINIGSLFSFLGGQWSPVYAASKHGMVGFTKAYCDELAQFNIQVNCIAPGYFATPLTEKTRNNVEMSRTILNHIPANRWGDTMDLMGTIIFLASSASNYINGTTIVVDGGYLVR